MCAQFLDSAQNGGHWSSCEELVRVSITYRGHPLGQVATMPGMPTELTVNKTNRKIENGKFENRKFENSKFENRKFDNQIFENR